MNLIYILFIFFPIIHVDARLKQQKIPFSNILTYNKNFDHNIPNYCSITPIKGQSSLPCDQLMMRSSIYTFDMKLLICTSINVQCLDIASDNCYISLLDCENSCAKHIVDKNGNQKKINQVSSTTIQKDECITYQTSYKHLVFNPKISEVILKNYLSTVKTDLLYTMRLNQPSMSTLESKKVTLWTSEKGNIA